jgi:hypothetical protein
MLTAGAVCYNLKTPYRTRFISVCFLAVHLELLFLNVLSFGGGGGGEGGVTRHWALLWPFELKICEEIVT